MLDNFLEYLTSVKRFSPLTVRNYRRDVEAFFAWLGTSDVTRVTSEDIREWIVHRTETGKIGAASMNRELSSLRSFWRHLQRNGKVEKNIFLSIRTLKTPQRIPSFVPTTRMETVLDQTYEAPDRDALIILLFYSCGLRLAELMGIRKEDFSHDYTSLKVRGKGDKERIVPILPDVREQVEKYLEFRQNICTSDEKLLFSVSRSTVYRVVKGYLQRNGVQGKASPHVLRHTFATELLNHGADLRDIQELMGHASLQATQVYTHNNITRLQEVYAKAHPHARGKKETE